MKPKTALLVHPLFLASLFILLLNDISLKYEFHNWLTGKLSDITGLFVFSFFLLVFFPRRSLHVLLFCGIFFTWWKSSFSQSFIDAANSIFPFSIVRVIDYTDLFALAVLPVSYYIFNKNKDAPTKQPAWIIRIVSVICVFAFCNTSFSRHAQTMYYRDVNWHSFNEEFITRKTEDEILKKFDERGITYHLDSIRNYRMDNSVRYYQRIRNRADSSIYSRPLPNTNDTALYFKRRESPFYIIDSLVIGDDLLRNVEIRFYRQNNKKTGIEVMSFDRTARYWMDPDTRKWYKRSFKDFFK